jgi:hypothetical protein
MQNLASELAVLALDLGSILKKLLHQKTFILLCSVAATKLIFMFNYL